MINYTASAPVVQPFFGTKSSVNVNQLIARDGWQCAYCQRFLTVKDMTVDHIQPTLRGGPDTLANTVISCAACNARKGDMNLIEYRHWLAVRYYVDDIYAQTAAVNAKTVSVKTAFEVYEIPAEVLLEAVREMEVQEELAQVMTPAEIEREFGLADGTVRQAIFQGYFTRYRKADARTILIRRADAEVKWKK
jgi:hypothetical protein